MRLLLTINRFGNYAAFVSAAQTYAPEWNEIEGDILCGNECVPCKSKGDTKVQRRVGRIKYAYRGAKLENETDEHKIKSIEQARLYRTVWPETMFIIIIMCGMGNARSEQAKMSQDICYVWLHAEKSCRKHRRRNPV